MINNIGLIGSRGTGKTTISTILSKILDMPIYSTDIEIEKKTGMKIADFIEKNGWDSFREIETEILEKIINLKNHIFDFGGGIILKEDNQKIIINNCTVFWLKSSVSKIKERLKKSPRPPLSEMSYIDEISEILKKRAPIYRETSNFEINTSLLSPYESARVIIDLTKRTHICLSIFGKNIYEMLKEIKIANKYSSIIELRLDLLKDLENINLKEIISSCKKETIVTLRDVEEGGNFKGKGQLKEKILTDAIINGADFVDIENSKNISIKHQVRPSITYLKQLCQACTPGLLHSFLIRPPWRNTGVCGCQTTKAYVIARNEAISFFEIPKLQVIRSCHFNENTPDTRTLEDLYCDIKKKNPSFIKIVTYANSINDNFRIFELLKNKNDLIGFCMGQRGEISRILAPFFGSRLTYAPIKSDRKTAPGQLNVKELLSVYNFNLINKDTRILGVIGKYAENSLSKYMHNANFKKNKLNYVYVPFKVDEDELGEFIENFREFEFCGAAVTIPHKIEIIKYLDKLSPMAKKIGAVNTIVNKNGKLTGYNTDCTGAITALMKKTKLKEKKILVIGAGGAARAICYGLKEEGSFVTISNRNLDKGIKLAQELNFDFVQLNEIYEQNPDIIINTTSVGMYPNADETILKSDFLKGRIIFDIVYRPIMTKLIRDAIKEGAVIIDGAEMLLYQGIEQYKLWTGVEPSEELMRKKLKKLL